MKEQEKKDITKVYNSLKDFQRATVEYTYNQLYIEGRHKMLVADEVGLGKTIVAKGLIAKAYENFNPTEENKVFNVIYICSNQALAAQNIQKLNILGVSEVISQPIERLAFLAKNRSKGKYQLKLDSLTPGTSIYLTKGLGNQEERAILYSLLSHYPRFQNRINGLKWLLIGYSGRESWEEIIQYYSSNSHKLINNDLFRKFKKKLTKTIVTKESYPVSFSEARLTEPRSLWRLLSKLCDIIDGRKKNTFTFQKEIIKSLRHILTKLCLEYLDADLFILDEFQRYIELIKEYDEDSVPQAVELAQAVFDIPKSKILMLSATPFKPYTTDFDEQFGGENHYKEYRTVLEFLYKNSRNEDFWDSFENDRKKYFDFLRQSKEALLNKEEVVKLKDSIERAVKKVIVRTERIVVSEDKNVLINNQLNNPLDIHSNDIKDFIKIDTIYQNLKRITKSSIPMPLEYSKSAPCSLSFMDNYKLKDSIRGLLDSNPDFGAVLKSNKEAWINLKDINDYKPLFSGIDKSNPPNAKLRLLYENSVYPNGWKLLWIPPTIKYYEPYHFYKNTEGYSKSLVFSSWVLVPRMISCLLSYEAERLSVGNRDSLSLQEEKEKRQYFKTKGERRSPIPQLIYKIESSIKGESPQNMSNYTLLYPSLTLSRIYNPKLNILHKKSLNQIIEDLKSEIESLFTEYNLLKYVSTSGEPEKWYWAAPLLLDKFNQNSSKHTKKWLFGEESELSFSNDTENPEHPIDDAGAKQKHFEYLKECFTNPNKIGLGKIPDDLFEVLAYITIASPAVSICRSLSDYYTDDNLFPQILKESFNVSDSFITLFNKPESISIIRLAYKQEAYWRRVLKYSADGNIQSMLDEYVYLLYECENFKNLSDLSEFLSDVMSIRTISINVDDYETFIRKDKKTLRCHFAIDYGSQSIQSTRGVNRMINIRQAFNSPFRPFVLSSTSIGQEGLDFHYYCRRIFHWNLPSNAIDIEQREGRINRYKGMVIRQNIVQKYLSKIKNIEVNLWDQIFEIAKEYEAIQKNKCELVPYWHIEPSDKIKIERFVPLYPMSKDIEKFRKLEKVLGLYRLTFGQPRQEELVEALMNQNLSESEIEMLRNEFLLNLSPILFNE